MGSRPRIQVVGLNHKTYSRGSVEAVSADSADAPKVTANYFKERLDFFGMWIPGLVNCHITMERSTIFNG